MPYSAVTLTIRDPQLLAEFAQASLYTLGSAYVEGRLDLQGPMLQVIEIGDRLSAALGVNRVPAISSNVMYFPAHLARIVAYLSEANLEVVDVESLRLHYARTLELWSGNLEAHLEQAAQQVEARALRIWRLYLAGCAHGFRRGWINLHQVLACRAHADGRHELPWSRADLYAG